MLTINAPQFDIEGHIMVRNAERSGLFGFGRRVSRMPTLDGGAAINDFGYSASDRTFDITWNPESEVQVEQVRRMAQVYGRLIISFSDGCYLVAPENFSADDETVTLTALVEMRLDS